MRLVGVVAAMAIVLSSAVSHAALTGPERANFIVKFRQVCFRILRDDPRGAGVQSRTFSTICACAGSRIADQVDFSQLFAGTDLATGRPKFDPQVWQDLGGESIQYCLNRHGGYMPGMIVTPNK
jgi:hypothetical protein